MKKIFLLVPFFFLIQLNQLYCQRTSLGIYGGYGIYSLKSIKEFQLDIKNNIPFEVKAVIKFPDHFNYMVTIDHCIDQRNYVGLNAANYFTGARSHIEDYSGEYKLDFLLTSFRIGIHYRIDAISNKKLLIYFKQATGIIGTLLSIDELFKINSVYQNTSSYHYQSKGLFLEPSFGLEMPLYKRIHINTNIGYQIDFNNNLKHIDISDQFLRNTKGEIVSALWTGLRLSIGISYDIHKKRIDNYDYELLY